MRLCKHQTHQVIDHIKAPKYSTNEILIGASHVMDSIEHYIIRFTDEGPREQYGWFYLNRKDIENCKKQPNGRGTVYCVPLDRRQKFEPIAQCIHDII